MTGAAFPLVVLPEPLRWVAYLLPTTHALDLMRVNALGTRPLLPPAAEWTLLLATSAAFILIGRRAWLATERGMRIRGTLTQH